MLAPVERRVADRDQITRFVNVLFRNCVTKGGVPYGGRFAFRAFRHRDDKPVLDDEWEPLAGSPVARAAELATAIANRDEAAVFCPPVCLFNTEGRARVIDVLACPVIVVELDKEPSAAKAKLEERLGPATLVVASGGVWLGPDGAAEDKLHVYWRLATPAVSEDERELLRIVRRAAADLVEADTTAVPLAHPLRWPGSWHTKSTPRLCTIVGGDETRDIELVDAAARLEVDHAAPSARRKNSRGDGLGFSTPEPWTAEQLMHAAHHIPNVNLEWDAWNKHGMAFYDASHDSEAGFEAFDLFSQKDASKYDAGKTQARWEHYASSPPDQVSGNWLRKAAVTAGADVADLPPKQIDEDRIAPDPAKYFEKMPDEEKPPRKKRELVRLRDAAKFALAAGASPLIKGLLDQQTMSVLYGDSNVGKTFVAMDMAYHVATGTPYAGMRVAKMAVVYVVMEGGNGVDKRADALLAKYGADADPDFHLLKSAMDLRTSEPDLTELVQLVRSVPDVGLVVIDTLSRALAGGDENSPVDMGNIVRNLDAVRNACRAHIMIVHHTGKDKARGARGHSSLRAATDTEIEVEDGKICVTKQRDLDKSWTSAFDLIVHTLGADADGEPITSCTVTLKSIEDAKREALLCGPETALEAMRKAWEAGEPWQPVAKGKNRHKGAAQRMLAEHGYDTIKAAETALGGWLREGLIAVEMADRKNHVKGYRVLGMPGQAVLRDDIFG